MEKLKADDVMLFYGGRVELVQEKMKGWIVLTLEPIIDCETGEQIFAYHEELKPCSTL